ncbi:MAG: chemotaxis protein CheV [Deltaproteobacteria bacterium]|nr:chemotaxis protein CheV [Deltaproteobacteria bacterium]
MTKFVEPEAYLRSGSNELKILEYSIGRLRLGINILKVSRILERPSRLVQSRLGAHRAVVGIFEDHGRIIPLVELAAVLGLESDRDQARRVIITEFFDEITGFLVDSTEQVHTILWTQVQSAEDIMGQFENPYILAIARPTEEHNILLVDYEKVVLELAPNLAKEKITAGVEQEWRGNGQTVLVAEDSTPVREMLKLELDERNLKVLTARDGEEAGDIFDSHPEIALVIEDVEMPKCDGLALLGYIRQHTERGNTPVLIYSSIGDIGMKERANVMSANGHITKLNMEELLAAAKKLLQI